MPVRTATQSLLLSAVLLLMHTSYAHNGTSGHAVPLGNIVVDGNFNDWPKNAAKYQLSAFTSENEPKSANDFSGYFQVGYRMENKSLYLAVTVTDDSFIEDTSSAVGWNTQDGLEIYLDARHLPATSGVASFMYSKKLRNINKAMFDPFAKNASWDIMEVVMVHRGKSRHYEWRIQMGDQLRPGKSIGFDVQCFDKDADSTFTFAGWGKGEYKYRSPKSLADVLLLPGQEQLATISGKIAWNNDVNVPWSKLIRITSTKDSALWLTAEADSVGNYTAQVPVGDYEIRIIADYFMHRDTLYSATPTGNARATVTPGKNSKAPTLNIVLATPPDLIPERGILHGFNTHGKAAIDSFIETYRRYYHIPGVSLAVIKDGRVAYYKTYGVRNSFTGEKVDTNTLFEAASITKPVFAYAVQRLAERGVIDLDKPLYLYLPYKDIEHDERYKLITAKHVLTHRTGFPNWRWMNPDQKLNLLFTPGTKYNYSGEGFEYLKMVVERITGKKVEQVLREEVIGPMQLYHTFFSRNDSLKRMAANGHYNMLPVEDDLPEQPGMAYSMHTEARVFTNFILHLMEQKGLSAATYKTMFSKHSEYEFDPGEERPEVPTYMGMSLQIRETPLGVSFGHGGNNGDFTCTFEAFKDLKMGYVVFTNSNTSYPLLANIGKFLIEGK